MIQPTRPSPWTVLLIGGSSRVGKTMIAERVARQLGVPWSEVDDFYTALHESSTSADQPAIHFFDDDAVWEMPPELLCQRFIEAAEHVSHSLESVVAHHLATASPMVLEGIWVVPALAAQKTFLGHPGGGQVRAVFLLELDEEAILKSMPDPPRWFDRHASSLRRSRAHTSVLYSEWLEREAKRCQLPTLTVRPWPTLADRILAATR